MRFNNNHITEDELAKYLSNNASIDEKQEVEKWLEDPQNRNEFSEYKQEWEMLKDRKPVHVNVDAAWQKMEKRISEGEAQKEGESATRSFSVSRGLQIAASLLIFVALGIGFWSVWNSSPQAFTAAANQQNQVAQLPDNSTVYLNSLSELNIHQHFNKNNRSVDLTGEAFFDIAPNPEKPFIIKAKQTKIEVLGTSFTVNTSLPNDQVKVCVKTGSVKFYQNEKQVILTAGETGIFQNGVFKQKPIADPNFDAWHTRKMVFKNDSLSYVLATIEKVYQVEVVLNTASAKEYKLTGTYSGESLQAVARALEATFPVSFNYKEKRNQLIVE